MRRRNPRSANITEIRLYRASWLAGNTNGRGDLVCRNEWVAANTTNEAEGAKRMNSYQQSLTGGSDIS